MHANHIKDLWMSSCASCGSTGVPFQSKTQCYICAKERVKHRYKMRWPGGSDDLYVLRCAPDPDGERWGFKIGRSSCLARRMAEHARHMPFNLETQAVYEGCGAVETRVHHRLAVYRSTSAASREWFLAPWPVIEAAILAEIEQARQNSQPVDVSD